MISAPPPEELPVFPLTGVLLLPGLLMPFHIFEPRYVALVADALAGARYLGMIQPVVPRQDNRPPPGTTPENPELYPVGCAGRIEQSEKTPDGRFLIHLRGVIRFRSVAELPLVKGYRRVRADYREFSADGAENPPLALEPLLELAERWGRENGHDMGPERLRALAGEQLVNGLATSLPFAAPEKQALLEAAGLPERMEMLVSLLSMGVAHDPEGAPEPPGPN